jgi:flagellar biosynthesis chaperone FliJ
VTRRDPLQVLSRIRGVAVTEAQRALAAALAAETRGEAALEAARETLRHEQRRTGFAEAVAFAAWLPQARARIARSEAALKQATAEVARCRAALAARRGDVEAVATLLREHANVAALAEQRRGQAILDDAGAQMSRRARSQA